ncbi:ribosome assembly RNA-binding protein YhbY [Brochothrix campestris]|uniref:RNA binding protein n=1 Tax=Brochothrix campestris FSL F6-1037 TaxID=1265861 RepID=W7CI28_9LIST|nr:ribosome assembly RNA-binding protein YhbY [Brochothrix campestris]EUJ35446.1 RNA binding protein [Brochothrix campestris FSL F6-1037]
MLTGKQKRFLRSEAHHLTPIFQIGKGGVNSNMTRQIKEALEVRELIKISVLQNSDEVPAEVAQILTRKTKSLLVQVIGKTIILYRTSKTDPKIKLPS